MERDLAAAAMLEQGIRWGMVRDEATVSIATLYSTVKLYNT